MFQNGGVDNSANTNCGPIERHLPKERLDQLDDLAADLPESAKEWLFVEYTNEGECGTLAKEIYDVLHRRDRVAAVVARLTEPNPSLRGVYVTAASETDEHFEYAQRIATIISTPNFRVHFEKPKDPKPGIVKVVILRAEPVPATALIGK